MSESRKSDKSDIEQSDSRESELRESNPHDEKQSEPLLANQQKSRSALRRIKKKQAASRKTNQNDGEHSEPISANHQRSQSVSKKITIQHDDEQSEPISANHQRSHSVPRAMNAPKETQAEYDARKLKLLKKMLYNDENYPDTEEIKSLIETHKSPKNAITYLNMKKLKKLLYNNENHPITPKIRDLVKKHNDNIFEAIKSLPKTRYTYILSLKDNYYYIGTTLNFEERYKQHLNGTGAEWTKIHKPLDGKYLLFECKTEFEAICAESVYTIIAMLKHGIKYVRGANICNRKLMPSQINQIISQLDTYYNRCNKCHIFGHRVDEHNDDNTKTCSIETCNSVGHIDVMCPNTPCAKCNNNGHLGVNCPFEPCDTSIHSYFSDYPTTEIISKSFDSGNFNDFPSFINNIEGSDNLIFNDTKSNNQSFLKDYNILLSNINKNQQLLNKISDDTTYIRGEIQRLPSMEQDIKYIRANVDTITNGNSNSTPIDNSRDNSMLALATAAINMSTQALSGNSHNDRKHILDENEKLKLSLQLNENSISELKNEIKFMNRSIIIKDNRIYELETQFSNYKEHVQIYNNENERLKSSLQLNEDLKNKIITKDSRIYELETQFSNYKVHVQKYIDENEKLQNKIEYLNRSIETKDNRFDELEIEYSDYKKQIQNYKDDSKNKDRNSALEKDREIIYLHNMKETYQDEIIKLRKALEDSKKSENEYRDKYRKIKEQVSNVETREYSSARSPPTYSSGIATSHAAPSIPYSSASVISSSPSLSTQPRHAAAATPHEPLYVSFTSTPPRPSSSQPRPAASQPRPSSSQPRPAASQLRPATYQYIPSTAARDALRNYQ